MTDLSGLENAGQTGLAIVEAVSPSPAVATAARLVSAALSLAQAGTQVYGFLNAANATIAAAQAAGRDLTDADWQAIDAAAAANLAALKAYAGT